MAAFTTCAIVTLLLLLGWCRDEEMIKDNNQRSYGRLGTTSGRSSSGDSRTFEAFWNCAASSDVSDSSLVLIAILGGFSGAVGEALPLGVDDNLSMPLVSGAIFSALQKYVGD